MTGNIERNVSVFYLYKVLFYSSMRGPILIYFMTKTCKMDLSEVYFCEACCVVFLALLQIPTGVLADKWGRVKTIRIGCLLLIAELFCFSIASEHIMLWIANALWAIGSSFISGADTALVYDSLKQKTQNEAELEIRYRNLEGKSGSYSFLVSAILSLTSGFLANINIRIPLFIDLIIMIIGFFVTFLFVEPTIHSNNEKTSVKDHALKSIKYVISRNYILWIISFTILINVTSKLWFFTYNPYFSEVGLDVKYFGIVFFSLNIIAGISGYFANYLSNKLSGNKGIALSIGSITIPMIIMGVFVSKWCISLVLFQNFVRGYLGPFVSNMLHKRTESYNRATISSVKSTIHQFVEVVCMASFGIILNSFGLSLAITWLGISSSIIGVILIVYYMNFLKE